MQFIYKYVLYIHRESEFIKLTGAPHEIYYAGFSFLERYISACTNMRCRKVNTSMGTRMYNVLYMYIIYYFIYIYLPIYLYYKVEIYFIFPFFLNKKNLLHSC